MDSYSESAPQVKKKKYGPKKDFLSRLSFDSDSASSSSGDKFNHFADRFSNLCNGNKQSTLNQSEKGLNQSQKSFDHGFNHPARRQSSEEQKFSLNASNQSLGNSSYEFNQSAANSTYLNNQSVKKHCEQNNLLNANNHSVKRQSSDIRRKFHTEDIDKYGKNSHATKRQSSSTNQSTDSKEPASSIFRRFSSGTDSSAASKRTERSADSISMMSLPDELRLSFSELEEGSLQLDDLDLEYCPTEGGNDNAAVHFDDDEKSLEHDSDLHKLAAVISSTSEQQTGDKQITEMTKVSEEFMTKDGQASRKEQNNVTVKSENNSSSNITWDDIVQWGVNAQQVSTVGSTGEVLKQKKTISPRRSSKNKHMENVSCQVCGDMAAGFYCGAFICEACKKFYMRAYKQDKLKYVCLREKKCIITKESRVQCQYCRFQKCVSLNMFIPKQGEGESNKDTQMSDIPCRVCSAPSSGFHFGAITCEGCKGFFRRMAKEREPEKYQCNKKGNCEINMVTRNLCKACRYKSCKQAGMSVEGSRIGRQPNSVKHAISMELKQGKPEGGTDMLTKVKEEPIDESSVDFLTENNKSDSFSFWDQNSNAGNSVNKETSLRESDINLANVVSKQSSVVQSVSDNVGTWPTNNLSFANRITPPPPPPTSSDVGSKLPSPSKTQTSVGNYMNRHENQQTINGTQVSKQDRYEQIEIQNERQMPPPPRKQVGGHHRGQHNPVNSLVFTPSPVTQFLSTIPNIENKHPRETKMNHKVPSPMNITQNMHLSSSVPQQPVYSPTSTTPTRASPVENKPIDQNNLLGSFKTMTDFINKIIDAGKCLQLLNYRVFDTDVNPTTSMNVDDIKALFKSKYMDPKAGNVITSKCDMSVFSTRESTWNYMMTNFHHNTYITIRFAKLVPGFKTLSLNDQVKLIQSSIYPIELLNMSKVYDPSTRKYNYFTYTKEEENIMMEQFPMLRVFQEHFLHVGEMVTSFQFTDEEFALLSALLLFPAEVHGLENPKAVEQLQNQISGALQAYEEKTFPEGLTRYGILLVRVAELVQCLLQHNLAIGLLLTHNPTIKVPQLFHELIIESIKEGQKL